MGKDDLKQKISVRRYVEYLKNITDLIEVPKTHVDAFDIRYFIKQINDYKVEIMWNYKNLASEIKELDRVILELENKLDKYNNTCYH